LIYVTSWLIAEAVIEILKWLVEMFNATQEQTEHASW